MQILVQLEIIRDLILKHLREEITEPERAELQSWRESHQENEEWFNSFTQPDKLISELKK